MVIKLSESEFDDGLNIFFNNLHKFSSIADIIEKNSVAKLSDHVVGISSLINLYKIKDFEFHLMLREDIGICIRLPVERDREQDEKNYEKLRKIAEELITLLKTKKK